MERNFSPGYFLPNFSWELILKPWAVLERRMFLGNMQSSHLYYCETWESKKTEEKSHSNSWKLFFFSVYSAYDNLNQKDLMI